MERFKQLVQEKYVEPKNEEILGSFLHIEAVKEGTVPVPKKKKKENYDDKKHSQRYKKLFYSRS